MVKADNRTRRNRANIIYGERSHPLTNITNILFQVGHVVAKFAY